MFRERANAQDTGDVDRFGPLRSVIPYSCVLVDLCMKELQRAGEQESSNSRNPLPLSLFYELRYFSESSLLFLFWIWIPFLSGQGPPFISQGDTTCTTSPSLSFWVGAHPIYSKTWLAFSWKLKHCLFLSVATRPRSSDLGDHPVISS